MVVIDKTVSEEFVYNMMEIMFDNIDQITSSHPAASGLTLESAVESLPIPLHPGAEKYFKDKGVL
jgi:TRAP transporter TAXI family solute receptor